jgi:hypothetical protein
LVGGDDIVLAGRDLPDRVFTGTHFTSLDPAYAGPGANCMYVNEFAADLTDFAATVVKCR